MLRVFSPRCRLSRGEVGVSSPWRWLLDHPISCHVSSLLADVRQSKDVVSGEGLGMEYTSGYGAIGKKAFEEVEKKVRMERARLKQELKMRRHDEL